MKIAICFTLILAGLGFSAIHAPQEHDEEFGNGLFHTPMFHMFPHHMDIEKHLDQLGVTEEQKTAAAEILKAYGERSHEKVEALLSAKMELFEQIHADEFNEAAIREASRKAAALEEEVHVIAGKIVRDLRGLLTPEQLERLKEMHPKTGSSVKDHFDHIHGKIKEWIDGHCDGK